ncbi:hypothetical protein ACFQO7_03645 [Catellatospora aurea]|uniref:Lipoprotein LprG n=1 Tax=Catellatospora aurea TaxID=1337874 RepID=A0ABW2GRX3_9ACTN
MAVLAAAAIGLSGCGSDGDAAPATSAPPASAEEQFAKASLALTTQPVQFSMEVGGQVAANGWLDVTGRQATVVASLPFGGKTTEMNALMIGDDVWLKVKANPRLAKWMHTTAADVAGTTFDMANPKNPGGVLGLVNAVNKVQLAGPGLFQGTVDMTTSPTYDPSKVGAHAEKLRAVPFVASTDGEGRLTSFEVDLSQFVPGMVMAATYSYVTPVTVSAPPADEVTAMPADLLAAIRG